MSTADALNQSAFSASEATTVNISGFQRFCWSVRRELWENHSLFIAPLAAGALAVVGFLIGSLGIAHKLPILSSFSQAQQLRAVAVPLDVTAGLQMAVGMIVALFYCLDALHGERRDRSILFWKSLPVSDLTAVLAKAAVPLLVLPLILFVAAVITQWFILLIASAVLLLHGQSPAILWTQLSLSQRWLLLLYHLYAVHSFWYAPFFGYLLFISGWARRTPFLWAFLPPIAISLLETLIFRTNHFSNMITNRLHGGNSVAPGHAGMPIDPSTQITLGHFLATPGLWIGLLLTAIFLVAAAQLRRYRSIL